MKQQRTLKPLAVVTGAANGIGLATAQRFAREGYRVAALDKSEEGLRRMKHLSLGAKFHPYPCDLNDVPALTPLARRIVGELGAPRALVNNAGAWFYAPITETTDEQWQVSLNVNLVGAAALVRGFAPAMKTLGGAAIVNVSSRNALSSSPKASTYDAAKAGLLAFTRTLAVELGEFGIRANAVCPGVIQTTAHQKEFDDPTFVKNYLRLIPLNRFGKPENIASAIFFLASDESAFMTGQYMVVDGGQMCGQNYSRIFGETKWVPASSAANKT